MPRPHTLINRNHFSAIMLGTACFVISGCGPTTSSDGPGTRNGASSPTGVATESDRPVVRTRTAGLTESLYARSLLVTFGAIDYDGETLPLQSPDGSFIAAQSGVAPTLDTLHATPQATVPIGSSIQIHRLIHDTDGPRIVTEATLQSGLILGRSANERGFLVEAPRPDGERWIGLVRWEDFEVDWLVQDEQVNAFATLGPGGRLAWSSRPMHGGSWKLNIRTPHGAWQIGDENIQYVMPTWNSSGEGLFTMQLARDGMLSAVYFHGEDEAVMRQSRRIINLSHDMRIGGAMQTMVAHPAIVGTPGLSRPTLLFYHPHYNQLAVWRPFRTDGQRSVLLEAGTVAAAIDASGFVVMGTDTEVIGRPLDRHNPRVTLGRMTAVPRLTASSDLPYLLIAPSEERPKQLLITGMKILPVLE